jgi:hypothetical protein
MTNRDRWGRQECHYPPMGITDDTNTARADLLGRSLAPYRTDEVFLDTHLYLTLPVATSSRLVGTKKAAIGVWTDDGLRTQRSPLIQPA